MSRQKKTLRFHIDEMKVFDYMMTHDIRYLKDFYGEAGITMVQYYHCQNRGTLSLEHAWKLAEYMGCMIEDVIIVEEIEEENNMDKNNDIKVNKVNKWGYGIVDMSLWHLKDEFDALVDQLNGVYGIDVLEIEELTGDMYSSMDKVLERFNELESVHHKECGMISQYEEENRILREQRKKLTDARAELTEDNTNLEGGRDFYAERLRRLCRTLSDNDIITDWNEAALKWNLYKWDEVKNQWCSYDKATTCESCKQHYESEIKQIIELAKSYGLIIHDDRKDAMPDDAVNIGMCGHYYVLGGRNKEESKNIQKLEKKWKKAEHTIKELMQVLNGKNKLIDELKQHHEEELRIRCEEIDSKNKLIDELTHENRIFRFKNIDLKDTLEKDGEFGKNVGKRVADSIREGCDKGVYELHPYTRIDIHVEETNNMPTTFDRHAIPRIAVMFNNTQTEMERDTARHECEELNRKIKELKKENIDLKTTFALCERDANMARELCHTVAFNAGRARNKTPWFNGTYEEEN